MPDSASPITVCGAGIAGLAIAMLLARAGQRVQVWEQAEAPAPVGAGIQLGPNATRLLMQWGLADALRAAACVPDGVRVRSASSGRVIAERGLHAADAPWLCIHRAELHAILLGAAQAAGAQIVWGRKFDAAALPHGGCTIAADGVWSALRAASGDASLPQATGHWAWRCLLPLDALPLEWHVALVQPWWGAQQHVVTYPVIHAGRRMLNVVAFTPMPAAHQPGGLRQWAEPSSPRALVLALGRVHASLASAVGIASLVTRWPVVARPPLASTKSMWCLLQGRAVPLLGDAAHPMRPYMAQGAAMALEDAAVLAHTLARHDNWQAATQAYAQARWQRNAQLQARSERNGRIFHLAAPLSWARNAALQLRPGLMDAPQVHGWRLDAV